MRPIRHDAFRNHRPAGEIWAALQNGRKLTKLELAKRTGRHEDTIERELEWMANVTNCDSGDVIIMVETVGNKWRARSGVDLDAVARAVGTAGAAERQKQQHAAERARHREQLLKSPSNPGNARA